jgi:hypothetical protein
MAKLKTTLIATGIAAVLLGGIGVGLMIYVGRNVDTEVVDHSKDDELAIAGGKIAVENRFPEAQVNFGQTFVHWDGETPSVCGRADVVEQQDSFDGEERYVFSEGTLLIEEADGTDVVNQKWADVCA